MPWYIWPCGLGAFRSRSNSGKISERETNPSTPICGNHHHVRSRLWLAGAPHLSGLIYPETGKYLSWCRSKDVNTPSVHSSSSCHCLTLVFLIELQSSTSGSSPNFSTSVWISDYRGQGTRESWCNRKGDLDAGKAIIEYEFPSEPNLSLVPNSFCVVVMATSQLLAELMVQPGLLCGLLSHSCGLVQFGVQFLDRIHAKEDSLWDRWRTSMSLHSDVTVDSWTFARFYASKIFKTAF